jgi:lysophospholipid acyltransferase (LPLAT)-like uncharacterized protein
MVNALAMRITPSRKLVHAVGWGLTCTLRFHRFGIANIRAAIRASPTGTCIFAHWHQSLLAVLAPHHHVPAATLASHSRDGEIISRYLEDIGLTPIRGSSSRGGAAGARELIRHLLDGYSIVLNVDGPRGPFKEAKGSVPEIALRHGIPVIPLACRATRELSLKASWDRFRIPLPLSHLAVVYGEPLWFAGGDSAEERLARRRRMAQAIHQAECRATELVGKRDGLPPERYLRWMG